MPFTKKYSLDPHPPLALSWEEYEKRSLLEFNSLLETKGDKEKLFQTFFENNPAYLPGAFGIFGQSGHYPYAATVVTQPELTGLTTKIPDFMWLSCDSCNIYPILIEIEAPNKKWFTSEGRPHHKFVQARDQLTDWRMWFSNPNHRLLFYDYYGIPSSFHKGKAFKPIYVLIYGRRFEFENEPYLNEKRSSLTQNDEVFMTYDRIRPDIKARDMLCSKVKNQKYYAVSIPETIRLGPGVSSYYSLVIDKEGAVSKNKNLTVERSNFLLNRFSYWDAYGKKTDKGLENTGDKE
ncbi:Shedu anti-phage system protein SduA domain-containing protein [Paenibacillus contaminans]|uniref:Shedu protein SduA C-terminal domain-containing protein n=1 Tax=Paenibacillus contaminans TaxID=450362 RepID=A0A329LNN9_9BACL|nr:Shedu anti-phage system protein SduA domain-containing protein [Paenibacillus contaminans]RAV08722.1 hypothetical protein DQG23_40625 [Paenibacillus contaminans]